MMEIFSGTPFLAKKNHQHASPMYFSRKKPTRVLEGKARARLTVKNNNRGYLSRVDFARKFADFGGLFASVYGRVFFSARVPPTTAATNRSREIATRPKNLYKKSNRVECCSEL